MTRSPGLFRLFFAGRLPRMPVWTRLGEPLFMVCIALFGIVPSSGYCDEPLASINRRLPPPGTKLKDAQRGPLLSRLDEVYTKFRALQHVPNRADAEVLLKAVSYALRHDEFYSTKAVSEAMAILDLAEDRVDRLARGNSRWAQETGNVVRGYYSSVDGSPQPYGLEIPANLKGKVPLYVWLHGRGDKTTDMYFIGQRMSRSGKITPKNAIVLHPFGRQCIGFKSAGEIDVLEAVAHVKSQYSIDSSRVVLMGFSMGGAGVWHLGAHYADHWVAMSPGAGFAETAQYNRLTPEQYPPEYEQTLWGIYDVPNYTSNLFNLPVVAYSGENDKQIQAARVMESAFESHSRKLTHIIGPGMGHKYHPDSLADIMRRMDRAVAKGLDRKPMTVHFQTRTLRYNKMHWLEVLGLSHHWVDTRVVATRVAPRKIRISTENVTILAIHLENDMSGFTVLIDGVSVTVPEDDRRSPLVLTQLRSATGKWVLDPSDPQLRQKQSAGTLRKMPGVQGPIDDAFMSALLVVAPSGSHQRTLVDRWVNYELDHLRSRWRALYRGELPVKQDHQITEQDIREKNLILWGTPKSNSLLARMLETASGPIPLRWTEQSVEISSKGKTAKADSKHHIPVLIYPNPLNPNRYVVINSGPTFRESHDRTNSLQNPKLPDWAILDISQPPNAEQAGRPIAAGFFDESWK